MTPIDALILTLIDRQRQATENELAAIIEHVAQAPFASYRSHVPTPVRKGLEKLGMSLAPGKVPTVEWHLLKRVYLDQQWPVGTTEDDFLRDLHQAIVHPQVQVWTYRYYTHPYIGFLAPSHVQQVPQPERHIFVAYSPVFGTITTAYQTSGIDHVFDPAFLTIVQHR